MTNIELIRYIKNHDKFYQGWDITFYSHAELLKIKEAIEKKLEGLPEGYMLTSNHDHINK